MDNNKVKGARAKYIFLPTIIIIFILLVALVVITVLINKRSEKDSNQARKSAVCMNLVSSLQSRSSSASETASSFAFTPAIPTGPDSYKMNNEPITTYYENISGEQNDPHKIYDKLKNDYDIKLSTLKKINDVVTKIDYLTESQLHAFRILDNIESVDLREVSSELFDLTAKIELTDDEINTISDYLSTPKDNPTYRQKMNAVINLATSLLFSRDYSITKKEVAQGINNILADLQAELNAAQDKSDGIVWTLRRAMWALVAFIVISLTVFFLIMYRKLISPISNFAKDIQENSVLDDEHGLYEANYLAKSYNELLDKKSNFETKLQSVAETDPLTGFENRYSYNKFLAIKADSDSQHSTCIFMLDINNLKYVNDTFGHDKGDELIKNSSLAIKETFMNDDGKNCYRLGGDEFVAILDNIEETNITNYIYKFLEKQKEYKVSIATGYAYTSDVSVDGYEKLMIEADKRMYENKKEMKKLQKEGA